MPTSSIFRASKRRPDRAPRLLAATLALGAGAVLGGFTALPAAAAAQTPTASSCAVTVPLARAFPTPRVTYPTDAVTVGHPDVSVTAYVVTGGEPASVFVRLRTLSGYAECTDPVSVPASARAQRVLVELTGLDPSATYRFEVGVATAGGTSFGQTETFHTAAALEVASGVRLGPLELGGVSRSEAVKMIDSFLAAPLRFTYAGAYWSAPRARLGATLDPAATLDRVLAANAGSHLQLGLTVNQQRLDSYLAALNRRFAHPARGGRIRLLGQRAVVTPASGAVSVDMPAMASAIQTALNSGLSERLQLLVTKTAAPGAAATKAVVVRLQSQTLTAYLNGKPVLTTPVTTGRPALPTPVGSYHVLFRASPFVFHSPWPPGSPYWYPPTPVNWAMDFFGGDFLHDDPGEPANAFGAGSEDGPYASHGCVHIPHDVMSFLFNWLPVGSQVVVAED